VDQRTYNMRVAALLSDMRLKNVDPEAVAELLDDDTPDQYGGRSHQMSVKEAVNASIAYKDATPGAELRALRVALKAVHVDPESDAGQRLERLWIDEGLAVALGQLAQVARYKSAAEADLARTARFFTDDGRPLFRPLCDDKGNLLP
jgi:hypothetical protein